MRALAVACALGSTYGVLYFDGTQTLEMMMDDMFRDLDQCLEDGKVAPDVSEELRWAWDGVRGFYREAMQMTYEGVAPR